MLDGLVHEGATVARMRRSGGAFDPEGCRACDVYRANDLVAMVEALPGRWLLITLTIDRTLFPDPEAAYQRGNEYVRKAIGGACPRGIYFAAFEVQGKTGDGWPHWHVMAWCPDSRTESEVKAAVARSWRTRVERVNTETGEVARERRLLGWVDVSTVRDRRGAGIYIAKYLMKSWPAVPGWMLGSTRRFRKVRMSSRAYDVLAKLYRHERASGGRQTETDRDKPHRHRTRTLLERMARSGSALQLFSVGAYGRLSYDRTVPLARDRWPGLWDTGSLRALRGGPYRNMLFEVSSGLLAALRDEGVLKRLRREAGRYEVQRSAEIDAAWEERQRDGQRWA
jgi:hypothetical protein